MSPISHVVKVKCSLCRQDVEQFASLPEAQRAGWSRVTVLPIGASFDADPRDYYDTCPRCTTDFLRVGDDLPAPTGRGADG